MTRLVVLFAVFVMTVSWILAPTGVPPVATGAASATGVVGGSVLVCVLTGALFGLSVMTGNALAAGGAVVGAIANGCL